MNETIRVKPSNRKKNNFSYVNTEEMVETNRVSGASMAGFTESVDDESVRLEQRYNIHIYMLARCWVLRMLSQKPSKFSADGFHPDRPVPSIIKRRHRLNGDFFLG